MTRPIVNAEDVEEKLSTDNTRLAELVDILELKLEDTMDGAAKLEAEREKDQEE